MKITVFVKNYARVGYAKDDIQIVDYKEAEVVYNDKREVLDEKHFSPEGNCLSHLENEYDENAKLISSLLYDEEGILAKKTICQYDGEGDLCERSELYGEEGMTYTSRFTYANHLLVQQDSYDDGEFSYTEKKMEYEDGLLVKQIDFDDYGEKQYVHQYAYNENRELVSYVRDEVKDKDRRSYLYEYENGKKEKELVYNYSDTLIAARYFVYDEQGRLVEEENEDLDSYQKMVYQYEENHLAAVHRYDKKEKEVARTEFFVDEQGRDSKVMNYALDEVDPENLRLISEISYERE